MRWHDLFVRRTLASLAVMLLCVGFTQAQDAATLARDLTILKGGYADKKKHLEELRIRAYIPILLKAVGKGPTWKPGHPNWADTERRISDEWRSHYLGYLARMGRDTNFGWMDEALAREYARVFNIDELAVLVNFYRSSAGSALLALEKEFLAFYPDEMLRSMTRSLLGSEMLSARERELFRSPQTRERREFVALFESEPIIHGESLRIGGPYVDANRPILQQGALATAADHIDALRRKLDATALAGIQTFLNSETGRKERVFLGAAIPSVTPAQEDPTHAANEEAVFYKKLQQLSTQWRELAAKPTAK
jgi:hypothetical protein